MMVFAKFYLVISGTTQVLTWASEASDGIIIPISGFRYMYVKWTCEKRHNGFYETRTKRWHV